MTGLFVSDYVFNMSKKVLSQTEINANGILEAKPKVVRKTLHSIVNLLGTPLKVLQHLNCS